MLEKNLRCSRRALALALVLLPASTANSAETPADGKAWPVSRTPVVASERISSVLRQQIAAEGSADAVIFLSIPRASSRESHRAEVARAQDEVLALLGPVKPLGFYRFTMTPALAARLTAAELGLVERLPRVVAVGPNLPATVGMSQSIPLVGGDRPLRG